MVGFGKRNEAWSCLWGLYVPFAAVTFACSDLLAATHVTQRMRSLTSALEYCHPARAMRSIYRVRKYNIQRQRSPPTRTSVVPLSTRATGAQLGPKHGATAQREHVNGLYRMTSDFSSSVAVMRGPLLHSGTLLPFRCPSFAASWYLRRTLYQWAETGPFSGTMV